MNDDNLDPQLIEFFTADAPAADDAFVAAVLLRMQRTRRLRLIRQMASLVLVLAGTAFLAPYVARQTFLIADWFTNQLPATGMALLSSIGCSCGALFAWGVARWARTY